MRKEFTLLLIIVVAVLAKPLYADLIWQSGGTSIDELILEPLQVVTVQLYCNDPVTRFYDVTIGNAASPVADITQVTPLYLAGDWAYASAGAPDWWDLHCEWDPSTTQPISVWGDHWDVTIKGLSQGNCLFNSDYYGGQGSNDILSVVVIPEPCSVLLLGLGGLALTIRSKKVR